MSSNSNTNHLMNGSDSQNTEKSDNNFVENNVSQTLKGKAIQIAKSVNGKLKFNEQGLQTILLNDNIRDKPVVVISIAGDMRKGKSFLMNFFLRYLNSNCGENEDWIGRNQNIDLEGFKWRAGSEKETIGIMMWSQPYFMQISDGRQVAVLLVDTQGCFDSEITVKDSAIIFALSLLSSSIFIFNLFRHIQENDLDHLHIFSDYGLLAHSDNQIEKPFQELIFLVRDWSFPSDYPYGSIGGNQMVDKILIEKKTENNKRVRDFIERTFENRIGYLLPHPGKEVATNPNFKGRIADIDPEFIKHIEDFVTLILSTNNLIIKKIGGLEVNGYKLYIYFSTFAKKFSGTELPEPKTLLEATAEVNHLLAVMSALEHYHREMEKICGGHTPHLSRMVLNESHLRLREEAINIFERIPKIGGQEFTDIHRNLLIIKIEEGYQHFVAQNDSKDFLRRFRPPFFLLVSCLVSFVLYYMSSSTGFTPVSHVFFIVSSICLGLFVTYILNLGEEIPIKLIQVVIVSLIMSLFSLLLLYWKHLFYFFRNKVYSLE